MRRTWVTATLALAGLLSAGTATALVNAHVLDVADTQATETNRVRLPSPPTTVPAAGPAAATVAAPTAVATAPTDAAGVTTNTVLAPLTDPAGTVAPAGLVDVPVGVAGFVTVDISSGSMEIVAMTPNDGWVLDDPAPGGDAATALSVGFRSTDGTEQVDCDLRMVDGSVVGELRGDDDIDRGEAEDPAVATSTATTVPSTPPTSVSVPSSDPTTPEVPADGPDDGGSLNGDGSGGTGSDLRGDRRGGTGDDGPRHDRPGWSDDD